MKTSVSFSTRRRLLISAAASMCAPAIVRAQTTSVLAVNDGVSYRTGSAEADVRYDTLLKDLNKVLGSKLVIQKVPKYDDLAAGLKAGTYDMAFVHPGHHAIRALQSKQYQLAALSKSHIGYKANILVRGDSPITKLDQLAGKKIFLPDADSITAWMARAALVEALGKNSPPVYQPLRYQDAIRFAVENKLGDAGATASASEVKEWLAAKHRVLFSTPSIPIKQFLVHKRLESMVEATRSFLLSQTDTAKISLPEGFAAYDEATLIKSWDWLNKGVITG